MIYPRGAYVSKAVLENIDIHAHHRFGIQTVSADGQVSELSEILYEGVEEVTSEENSDTESEMDMHAVIDENEYKHGAKRLVSTIFILSIGVDKFKQTVKSSNQMLQNTSGSTLFATYPAVVTQR